MTELKDLGLQSLKLNINDSIIEPIFAKEGDKKSRGLDIQILNNNTVIDTTDIDVEMYTIGNDKQPYLVKATAIDTSKGKYQIIYPSQILQSGAVLAELVLRKNDAVISSKKFKIEVESGIISDSAIEGHDAYPLFEKLLESAEIIKDIDVAIEEDKRKRNEKIRVNNEVIRQSQEQQRQESMTDIENRFNLLETSKQQDAEVINARTSTVKGKTFDSLNDRLEETEKELDKPLYSTPVETYDSIISLPDNTTNGQVSGSVRGETVTNLLGDDGDFRNDLGEWEKRAIDGVNTSNNEMLITCNVDCGYSRMLHKVDFIVGHKYAMLYELKNITGEEIRIELGGDRGRATSVSTSKFERYCLTVNFDTDMVNEIRFGFPINSPTEGNIAQFKLRNVMVIDLTELGDENLSEDELLQKYPFISNTKSTISSMRIKSLDNLEEVKSTAYLTAKDKDNKIVNLKSLPNEVSDEIDLEHANLVKRVSDIYELKADDIQDILELTNIDLAYTFDGFVSNMATMNSSVNGMLNIEGMKQVSQSDRDNVSQIGNYHTAGGNRKNTIYFIVKKGTTLEQAREQLAGTKLIYQLAEPEHIPIEIEGELQGYENGTVYFTPYIKDRFEVDSTKLIKLQYPIKAIDKLLKLDTVNAKWEEVEGELSEDGQTITVNEEGTYKVYGEIQEGYSTKGLKRIVTNINLNAQINSNTTAIEKINNKIYADADLFTAMLLQQEVRITALEGGMTV